RIEVMGFEASISRDPTEEELQAMESLLEQALDDGYAGFSTDALTVRMSRGATSRRHQSSGRP
ncbi:MAG: hypothetical protein R6V07_09935, partial [Armatimonadota bacterium]